MRPDQRTRVDARRAADLAISFALFAPAGGITTQGRCHDNIDAVNLRLSTRQSLLMERHPRGHRLGFVVWNLYNGTVSGRLECPIVTQFHLPGLWLVRGLGTSDYHHLPVVEWGSQRQTLFTLLCLPEWLPVHGALHALGSDDPRWPRPMP